jgi:hypothetical protein
VPLGREKKEREEPDWEITAKVPDIVSEKRQDVTCWQVLGSRWRFFGRMLLRYGVLEVSAGMAG